MQKWDNRLILGLVLIGAGVFYLLQTLGLLVLSQIVWAIAAGAAGVFFLVIALRGQWWAWMASLSLLGVAGLLTLEVVNPAAAERWGGSLFLGAIGLSFWIVYLVDRANWWAIIPGGVLATLAVVAGLEDSGDNVSGGAFFLGLGLTFVLVALAPNPHGRMRWAFIPAAVLLILGALLSTGLTNVMRFVGPVALIAVGAWFLFRTFRPGPNQPKVKSSQEQNSKQQML